MISKQENPQKKVQIIGMVHLETLPGYPGHISMDHVVTNAKKDTEELVRGGVDSLLIENTNDDPHQKTNSQETTAALTVVTHIIASIINIPFGLCVLWNDYKTAFAVAKVTGASFVRIPVFTEAVLTACGIIEGNPYDVISYRHKIQADAVKILADVQVKHAAQIAQRPIIESAKEASEFGADGLIVTGRFTGDPPSIEIVHQIRSNVPNVPVYIGSGIHSGNIKEFQSSADFVIVGTSLKENGRIQKKLVKKLVMQIQ